MREKVVKPSLKVPLLFLVFLAFSCQGAEHLVDLRDLNTLPAGTVINMAVGDNMRVLLTEGPTDGYLWRHIFNSADTTSANNVKVTYRSDNYIMNSPPHTYVTDPGGTR